MKLPHADKLVSTIVIGVIRKVTVGNDSSRLSIRDKDGDLHEIAVSSKLLKPLKKRCFKGSRVICSTWHGETWGGEWDPTWRTQFEVLHLLDGPRAGTTLTYHSSN